MCCVPALRGASAWTCRPRVDHLQGAGRVGANPFVRSVVQPQEGVNVGAATLFNLDPLEEFDNHVRVAYRVAPVVENAHDHVEDPVYVNHASYRGVVHNTNAFHGIPLGADARPALLSTCSHGSVSSSLSQCISDADSVTKTCVARADESSRRISCEALASTARC
ncbi:hypothetical protein MRX96_002992 [Rhipicephalus microplus]